jgi:flagellar hook-length control protein FliK
MPFGQSVRECAQARAELKADIAATESANRLVPKSPNAPTSMVQISLAAQANPPIVAREKPDILSLTVESLETVGTSETRSSASSQTSLPTSVLQRTETPVMIARQMAEALQKASDRTVEIALSPKELGRVRMSISAAEVGITVNVVAERPETLDLMRRHIEQLAHEFAELGYTNMEFAFAQGETHHESYDEDASGSTEATVLSLDLEAETSAPEVPLAATSGLDLRL